MPAQTATCTPRDTQADSRTGAAGHTHMGTREKAGSAALGSAEGWDTPTGDGPMHVLTHRVTWRCCHTQGQGGVSVTHIKKKSLSHACMNTGHLHAATRYKRPCHSQAHTCSHEPSHTGIIACRNSRCHSVKRPNVVTHQHMDTQCSNKYFRGSLRFCLQQNPCSQQN